MEVAEELDNELSRQKARDDSDTEVTAASKDRMFAIRCITSS
jgi:hypothetical protein